MARRGSRYTDMGRKIAALAKNQAELARILTLTQQSVSGKLTGKIAVTLKDMELLSEHYKVPMIYFVASPAVTPDLARAWERILEGPPELHQTLEIGSSFPAPFAKQLLKIVQAMNNTASYYADQWLRDRAMESDPRIAAESKNPYPGSQ